MINWDPRALEVLRRLEAAGHRAVLVGGCVRDSLLGIPPHDYDAATSALPRETEEACAGLRCRDGFEARHRHRPVRRSAC